MKLPNSLFSVFKIFRYGDRLKPNRDWFILLTLTALCLVASVCWNIFLFSQLENGKSVGNVTVPNHTAATSSISGVQTVFQKRAAQESNYQHAYTFIDPSLGGS
jgi:hypothetical protein